jgi:uncharacterized protein (TIGR03437 family)
LAADIAGRRPGTLIGRPLRAQGVAGGSVRFSEGKYVSVAQSPFWSIGAGDRTIEMWALFEKEVGGSIPRPGAVLLAHSEATANRNRWLVALGGGKLYFQVSGPGFGSRFLPLVDFTPESGRWYHLALTKERTTYKIFVNGLLAGSTEDSTRLPDTSAPLFLGQAAQIGFLDGRLDELAVYDRALAEADILAIYNSGQAGKCKALPAQLGVLPRTVAFDVISAGSLVQFSRRISSPVLHFSEPVSQLYVRRGGGGGGRGFNVASIDPTTGEATDIRNFDTWGRADAAQRELVAHLRAVPSGTLLLIATADEAGLTNANSCQKRVSQDVATTIRVLEELGSRRIGQYCFRSSWLMITTKGTPRAYAEMLAPNWEQITGQHEISFPSDAVVGFSAASLLRGLAPGSIGTLFGESIAASAHSFTGHPLPTELGGVGIRIRDSGGVVVTAPLFFVSPRQVNYVIPEQVRPGPAVVEVLRSGRSPLATEIMVDRVAPALFSADATGEGVAVALSVRTEPNGSQLVLPTFECGQTLGCYPKPIDVGFSRPATYLVLFGTGIRGRTSLESVQVKIGGELAPVQYAGPQSVYEGLDQVNVLLPATLQGRGRLPVSVMIDGIPANDVDIFVR